MSAALKALKAPNIDSIAMRIGRENPALSRDEVWSRAFVEHANEMEKWKAATLKRIAADPVVERTIRRQRAEIEARRVVGPEPNLAVESNRETARLMREEGLTHAAACLRLPEFTTRRVREWQEAFNAEVTKILARDAAAPVTLAVSRPAPPRAPAPATGFNPGMGQNEFADAIARGDVPVRAASVDEKHVRLMDRVRTLQARGGEFADYTVSFIAAQREIEAEDEELERRIEARAATYPPKAFTTHAHRMAHAKAEIELEDTRARLGMTAKVGAR